MAPADRSLVAGSAAARRNDCRSALRAVLHPRGRQRLSPTSGHPGGAGGRDRGVRARVGRRREPRGGADRRRDRPELGFVGDPLRCGLLAATPDTRFAGCHWGGDHREGEDIVGTPVGLYYLLGILTLAIAAHGVMLL